MFLSKVLKEQCLYKVRSISRSINTNHICLYGNGFNHVLKNSHLIYLNRCKYSTEVNGIMMEEKQTQCFCTISNEETSLIYENSPEVFDGSYLEVSFVLCS